MSPPLRWILLVLAGGVGVAVLAAGVSLGQTGEGEVPREPVAQGEASAPSAASASSAEEEQPYAGVHLCAPDQRAAGTTVSGRSPTGAATGLLPLIGGLGGAGAQAPFFAQNNAVWANQEYDHHVGQGGWCGLTIAQCGCAMTSVATVLALFKVLATPDGADLNPSTVNQWFDKDARLTSSGWVSQGYAYGSVVWTAANTFSAQVAARSGGPTVRFARWGSGNTAELRTELASGRPVVLEVPGHFIAAVGLEGEQVLINDPFYRDRTTLGAYAGRVASARLFEASQDLSAVVVTVPGELRVQVTDSQGRTTGSLAAGEVRGVEKAAKEEIPGSAYRFEAAWRDPTCVERAPGPGDGTNSVLILNPARDTFRVEVVRPGGGGTTVAVYTYDRMGKVALRTLDVAGTGRMSADYDPGRGVNPYPSLTPAPAGPPPPDEPPAPAGPAGPAPRPPVRLPTPTPTSTPAEPATADPTATPAPRPATQPPDTVLASGPSGLVNSRSARFSFSSPSGVSFECSLDGAGFAPCDSPQAYAGLADGAHQFRVRALDGAGNADASPAARSWSIDATPPDTNITRGPSGQTRTSPATFAFDSDDSDASFECSLGSAPFSGCTSPVSFGNLAEGTYTFRVRARDAAGNLDPTPASRTWTLNTTPPDTRITSAPASPAKSTTAAFSFVSSEKDATFQCSLDKSPFAACTSPRTYSNLRFGTHEFLVRAVDAAGNVDPRPAEHTWSIQTGP